MTFLNLKQVFCYGVNLDHIKAVVANPNYISGQIKILHISEGPIKYLYMPNFTFALECVGFLIYTKICHF